MHYKDFIKKENFVEYISKNQFKDCTGGCCTKLQIYRRCNYEYYKNRKFIIDGYKHNDTLQCNITGKIFKISHFYIQGAWINPENEDDYTGGWFSEQELKQNFKLLK